jgi:hypothetical protein
LEYTLFGPWGLGQIRAVRLVVVGTSERFDQSLEWLKIAVVDGGLYRLFHPVVARDEGGVRAPHRRRPRVWPENLDVETVAPSFGPTVERVWLSKQCCDLGVHGWIRCGSAQAAEKDRVIDVVRCEPHKHILEEFAIVILLDVKPELGAQDAPIGRFEARRKAVQVLGGDTQRIFLVVGEQR